MSSSSSQIFPELAERFVKLKDAKQCIVSEPFSRIQGVPHYLKQRMPIAKFYSPKLISFGPIHHPLQLGEQYKLMWASMYIEDQAHPAEDLFKKIKDHLDRLRGLFSVDATKDYDDKELAWMLFVDGCAVLQLLCLGKINNMDDWVYSLRRLMLETEQLNLVAMDLLLLENQLPYDLLTELAKDDPRELMDEFLQLLLPFPLAISQDSKPMIPEPHPSVSMSEEDSHPMISELVSVSIDEDSKPSPPNHLLDHLRTSLLVSIDMSHLWSWPKNPERYRSIVEFKEAGIRVKKKEATCLTDINFAPNTDKGYGELFLPKLIVTETAVCALLNLIAHEMCLNFKSDFGVVSYLIFLNSLIRNTDDVKALIDAEVLLNWLGSDQELLHLFRTAGTCAELVPMFSSMAKYLRIRVQMENCCTKIQKFYLERRAKKKCRTWMVDAYNTYFKSPWTIIALFAAFLGLLLTAIQTWYAVYHN